MTKSSSPLVRSYFVIVATITLFMVMFSAIQLITIGLMQMIPSANQPEQGYENCESVASSQSKYVAAPNEEDVPTNEELTRDCENRNTQAWKNWQHEQAADAVRDIAIILIALPLFLVHFKVVYRDMKGGE